MVKEHMKCTICNSKTKYYFSKSFNLKNLDIADYYECTNCGFVYSKQHRQMPQQQWNDLNKEFHLLFLGKDSSKFDPKWMERLSAQYRFIKTLMKLNLVDTTNWLDFGCGDGKLANKLLASCVNIKKFDRYCPVGNSFITELELSELRSNFVINTSVFEHLYKREDMEEILTIPNNCLLFHTMVQEKVPQDPTWYYLLPVHCSMHTNKSMQILFDEFGYKQSIYDIESRMWALFKQYVKIPAQIMNSKKYYVKNGFADYWKL